MNIDHLRYFCVAARQGNLLATSFHPELTGDTRLHELFLSIGAPAEAHHG